VTADKYAKPEIERRFVLDAVPAEAVEPVEITDRYIDGGHLRLRIVEASGEHTVYKLGHKHRPDPADAMVVLHTTIYLTEHEHSLLAQLPARVLRKTRYRIDLDGRAAAVDVLHGPHDGLVLLEVGFTSEEDPMAFVVPPWVGAESTLSGGDLAQVDD
jgi:CYTH domain-containing protein